LVFFVFRLLTRCSWLANGPPATLRQIQTPIADDPLPASLPTSFVGNFYWLDQTYTSVKCESTPSTPPPLTLLTFSAVTQTVGDAARIALRKIGQAKGAAAAAEPLDLSALDLKIAGRSEYIYDMTVRTFGTLADADCVLRFRSCSAAWHVCALS
jgi:hypothetical protein